MKTLTLLLVLTTCTSIPSGPPAPADALVSLTWREAYDVWFDAWCFTEQRCTPDRFRATYVDHDKCIASNALALPCHAWCNDPYPDERLVVLAECHSAVLGLPCPGTAFPGACWRALQ